jgi:hypothetical protein
VTSANTFIGIDFAGQSERNTSGIAITRGEAAEASIEVVSGVRSLNDVVALIERFATVAEVQKVA